MSSLVHGESFSMMLFAVVPQMLVKVKFCWLEKWLVALSDVPQVEVRAFPVNVG